MAIHDRSNGWEIMEEEARMKDKGFLYLSAFNLSMGIINIICGTWYNMVLGCAAFIMGGWCLGLYMG